MKTRTKLLISYEALRKDPVEVVASILDACNVSLSSSTDPPHSSNPSSLARKRSLRLRGIASAAHSHNAHLHKAHPKPVYEYLLNAGAVRASRPSDFDYNPRCAARMSDPRCISLDPAGY